MDDKGLFQRRHEQHAVELLDAVIKGNVITEPLTDVALQVGIPLLDDKVFDGLLVRWSRFEEFKPEFHAVIDASIAKDWEQVKLLSTEVLVKYINTPLGDIYERMIVAPLVQFLVGLFYNNAVEAPVA